MAVLVLGVCAMAVATPFARPASLPSWTEVAPLPKPRAMFGSSTIDGPTGNVVMVAGECVLSMPLMDDAPRREIRACRGVVVGDEVTNLEQGQPTPRKGQGFAERHMTSRHRF